MAKKAKKTAKKTTKKSKKDSKAKNKSSKAKSKSKKSTKSKSSSKKKKAKKAKKKSPSKPKSTTKAAAKPRKSSLSSHQSVYTMRNYPQRQFTINAELDKGSKSGTSGASVTGQIQEGSGDPFTYVVQFSDEFTSTKSNFNDEMYLLTAVSVMQSQIESHQHSGTLLRIHRDSGLIHTEPLKQVPAKA